MKTINLAIHYATKVLKKINQLLEKELKFRLWKRKTFEIKTLLKNFLTGLFLYGITYMETNVKWIEMETIGIKTGLKLVHQFLKKTAIVRKTPATLQEYLKETKWQDKGEELVQTLSEAFLEITRLAGNEQDEKLIIQIGSLVGGICLIQNLEKKIVRPRFLMKKRRREKLSKMREKLFFIKLKMVYRLHQNLRVIMPYHFNVFVQNFNRLFE